MKEKNGITLVVLVITIIVTLILAGVAISLITGEQGLFKKANLSATMYNQKSKEEAERLNTILSENYTIPTIVENIDILPPNAFNLIARSTGTSITVSVNETVSDTDATNTSTKSEIIKYEYKLNDGNWITPTTPTSTSYTFTNLTEGIDYTVSMRATDTAGNITEATNNSYSISTKYDLNVSAITRAQNYTVEEGYIVLVAATSVENANAVAATRTIISSGTASYTEICHLNENTFSIRVYKITQPGTITMPNTYNELIKLAYKDIDLTKNDLNVTPVNRTQNYTHTVDYGYIALIAQSNNNNANTVTSERTNISSGTASYAELCHLNENTFSIRVYKITQPGTITMPNNLHELIKFNYN